MSAARNASAGQLIVVIDDDPLALDAMGGLLRSWGYRVVTAASDSAALVDLPEHGQRPDLIICDYRLSGGRTGIEAIERLRNVFGALTPAFLVSGNTGAEGLRQIRDSGYQLLHKPVNATTLRATLRRILETDDSGRIGQ